MIYLSVLSAVVSAPAAEYIAQQWAILREHGLIKGEGNHATQ